MNSGMSKVERLLWAIAVIASLAAAYCFYIAWGSPRIELGTLADWLAAFGAGGAALVALVIATRDRAERKDERHEEDATVARLVQLRATAQYGTPALNVSIRNFGELPILDISIADATWADHPDARWGTNGLDRKGMKRPVLHNYWRTELEVSPFQDASPPMITYPVWFMHPTRDEPLYASEDNARFDLSGVTVKIQFTTANGVRWILPTKGQGTGDPKRISS